MNKYTVLLAYPYQNDESCDIETYLSHVSATDPDDAIKEALAKCQMCADDMQPLAVFEGWLEDVKQ